MPAVLPCLNTYLPPLDFVSSSTLVPDKDDFLCSEEWVYNSLTSLDMSKSSGPDDVSAYMLKYTAASICTYLLPLYLTCPSLLVVFLSNGRWQG